MRFVTLKTMCNGNVWTEAKPRPIRKSTLRSLHPASIVQITDNVTLLHGTITGSINFHQCLCARIAVFLSKPTATASLNCKTAASWIPILVARWWLNYSYIKFVSNANRNAQAPQIGNNTVAYSLPIATFITRWSFLN